MTKGKAYFVAAIMVILAGGFLYSLWLYAIWSYYVAIQAFGWYGLAMAGLHFAGWLQKDAGKEKHKKKSYFDWADPEE